MIEVKNLYKSFEGKEVLKNINTVFEDGKTNLIIGRSGSGKTVLMKNSTSRRLLMPSANPHTGLLQSSPKKRRLSYARR